MYLKTGRAPFDVNSLHLAPQKAYDYLTRQKLPGLSDFYYVTRDTGEPSIGLRSRGYLQRWGNTR
jgi:hypothetical protein